MMTLTDPLATQEVVISIVLQPTDVPKSERPLVLTLGVTGQPPVIRTGIYADLPELLESAWRTFDPKPQATTPTTANTAPPQQGLLDLF